MARYSHLPIYKSTYALTREIYRYLERLPKSQRFTIGERLLDSCIKCIQGIVIANGSEEKLPPLRDITLEIEAIWTYLRLLHDLQGISRGEFKAIAERLGEIAPQLSAWVRWEKDRLKNETKTEDKPTR